MRKHGFIRRIRRHSRSIAFIALIIFLFVAWAGSTVLEILRLNQLKADLTAQIAERQKTNSQLDEEIAQIGSQAYVERIARKYLGLYYPNEQIIIPVENVAQAKESTGIDANIKSEDSGLSEEESVVTDEAQTKNTALGAQENLEENAEGDANQNGSSKSQEQETKETPEERISENNQDSEE